MIPSPSAPSRGFTLMELLIVILIIGMLAGLLIPAVAMAREAARKAKARSIIANAASTIERYRTQNGSYPPMAGNLRDHLQSIDADAYGLAAPNIVGGSIVDPWGTAIFYRPFENYPFDDTIDDGHVDSANPPNPDSYQIWSFGPNTNDDDGRVDDINNWIN